MSSDPRDNRRIVFSDDFPDAVSQAMAEHGLTGNDVAARTGHRVKKQTISRVRLNEQFAMTALRYRLLCDALGLAPAAFAERSETPSQWMIPRSIAALVPENERPHAEWLIRRLYEHS